MRQAQHVLTVETTGQGFYDLTRPVGDWVAGQPVVAGMLTLFCRHSSASLVIQENADPDVLRDMETFFKKLVPEDPALYRHGAEGPDDMPAHIRSALTATSLNIPVMNGAPALGIWQGIYLFEHRFRGRPREIVLHVSGE